MKKTKIVATLGPATADKSVLTQMIQEDMNIKEVVESIKSKIEIGST